MQIFDLRRTALAVAPLGLVTLLAGCCCGRYTRGIPRTRAINVTDVDVPREGAHYKSTRAGGITDDIVEVYNETPNGPVLVAAYLLNRPTSNSAVTEQWIIGNSETWPIDLTPGTWLQTSMIYATLDDLCTFYGPQLGWGITPAPVYVVNYMNTFETGFTGPDEIH